MSALEARSRQFSLLTDPDSSFDRHALESMSESELSVLEHTLTVATRRVQRYLHWAEFRRHPLMTDPSVAIAYGLPMEQQLQLAQAQRALLDAEHARTQQQLAREREEKDALAVAMQQAEERRKLQVEEKLASIDRLAATIDEGWLRKQFYLF